MMKRVLGLTIVAGFLTLGLISCGDDTGSQFGPVQMPVLTLTNDLDFFNTEVNIIVSSEFGCEFKFLSRGRITKLGTMLPDMDTYRITLWELPAQTVHTTLTVQADSGQLVFADIPDVIVETGDEYAVTVHANDVFSWFDGGNTIFPAIHGDIQIMRYGFKGDASGITYEYPVMIRST